MLVEIVETAFADRVDEYSRGKERGGLVDIVFVLRFGKICVVDTDRLCMDIVFICWIGACGCVLRFADGCICC